MFRIIDNEIYFDGWKAAEFKPLPPTVRGRMETELECVTGDSPEELQADIDRLEGELKDAEDEINNLETELAAAEQTIADLRLKLEETTGPIDPRKQKAK